MTLPERISQLMAILTKGLTDRESIVQLGLLSIITEQPIYLYGRAGSGKKVIMEHLTGAFRAPSLQAFGHRNAAISGKVEPKDIITFNSFESDNAEMVHSVQIALEEHLARALILISRERPDAALSKAGLADSIHIVLTVPEALSQDALEELLRGQDDITKIQVPQGLAISKEEWATWLQEIQKVKISDDSFAIIANVALESEKNCVYISARRWRGIARIIKAEAFFSGRTETDITDTLFLGTDIWGKRASNEAMIAGFQNGMNVYLKKYAPDVEALEKQMRGLNRSVERVMNATPDTYRTVDFNGVPCIHYTITVAGEAIGLYAPESKLCTTEEFSPFNELRKEETRVRCNYMGSSICRISIDSKSKRMGMRASTSILSKEDMAGSDHTYEEFAKLPAEVLHANDPEKIQKNRADIGNVNQLLTNAIEMDSKALLNLKNIYAVQKQHGQDPFLNKALYSAFMEHIATQFKKVNEIIQTLRTRQEEFLRKMTGRA